MSRSFLRNQTGSEAVEWGLISGLIIGGLLLVMIALGGWLSVRLDGLQTASTSQIQGLRTVAYAAPNLAESKAFYTKVLGVGPYFDEPSYVGFNVGGYELALDPDAIVGDGVIVYWGVEDIEAEYDRLLKLGARPFKPIENVGGDIRVATVLDPAGNQFGIIYNPNCKLR